MAKINFGGTEEDIVMRDEFPLEKAREVLKRFDERSQHYELRERIEY